MSAILRSHILSKLTLYTNAAMLLCCVLLYTRIHSTSGSAPSHNQRCYRNTFAGLSHKHCWINLAQEVHSHADAIPTGERNLKIEQCFLSLSQVEPQMILRSESAERLVMGMSEPHGVGSTSTNPKAHLCCDVCFTTTNITYLSSPVFSGLTHEALVSH